MNTYPLLCQNGKIRTLRDKVVRQWGKSRISKREMEVLKMMAEGLSTKQIGPKLHISIKTVEKHRQAIYVKLKLHDRVTLTHYALAHKLVENKFKVKETVIN